MSPSCELMKRGYSQGYASNRLEICFEQHCKWLCTGVVRFPRIRRGVGCALRVHPNGGGGLVCLFLPSSQTQGRNIFQGGSICDNVKARGVPEIKMPLNALERGKFNIME